MKLIHKDGFTFDERNYWKNIIFHNLVDAFLLIFDMLQDQGDHVQDSRSEVSSLHSGVSLFMLILVRNISCC